MENATKAFYMAAAMLIALLVLSLWVYMFRTAGRTSESYEIQEAAEQLQAFNSQFEAYTAISDQDKNNGYMFNSKGNTPSDVISCANLAYSTNAQNDYDLTNSVIVELQIGGASYYVVPDENMPQNSFIKSTQGLGYSNISTIMASKSNTYSFYDFLKTYNVVRVVDIVKNGVTLSTDETIYQYYFDVDENGTEYSDTTGKVNKVTFTMYTTQNFSDTTTFWFGN